MPEFHRRTGAKEPTKGSSRVHERRPPRHHSATEKARQRGLSTLAGDARTNLPAFLLKKPPHMLSGRSGPTGKQTPRGWPGVQWVGRLSDQNGRSCPGAGGKIQKEGGVKDKCSPRKRRFVAFRSLPTSRQFWGQDGIVSATAEREREHGGLH